MGNTLISLFYSLFPLTPMFIGRYAILCLSNYSYISLILRILGHLLYFYITSCLYMFFAFVQFYVLITGFIIFPFPLNELSLNKSTYYTDETVRNPSRLMLIYREFQVVNLIIMKSTGILLIPLQFVISDIIMFITFVLTQYGNSMNATIKVLTIFWGCLASLFWIAMLEVGGRVYKSSGNTIKSWKYNKWARRKDRNIMNKFVKSCKPLMLNYGRDYVIKRNTVLKFISGSAVGIFRTMLALDNFDTK